MIPLSNSNYLVYLILSLPTEITKHLNFYFVAEIPKEVFNPLTYKCSHTAVRRKELVPGVTENTSTARVKCFLQYCLYIIKLFVQKFTTESQ